MKKVISFILAAALVFTATGCKNSKTDKTVGGVIGVSLAREDSFAKELVLQLTAQEQSTGISFSIKYAADSVETQLSDVEKLISGGAQVIFLQPVDPDEMSSILEYCGNLNVSVVNLLNSINGQVASLISCDYIEAGEKAGSMAANALSTAADKNVLLVEGDIDSFVSQMIYDGLMNKVSSDEYSIDSVRGNDERELAKTKTLEAINKKNYSVIVAYTDNMTLGVLDALTESGKKASVISMAANLEYLSNIYGCVYTSPEELADEIFKAYQTISSGGEVKSYIELKVKTLTDSSKAQGTSYAN